MFKSLCASLLISLAAGLAQAQPQSPLSYLSFQGYLTDPGGTPIDTPSVAMTFKLYDDGAAVWQEIHPNVSIVDGLVNVTLGQFTRLDTLAFSVPLELGITVGGDPELSPRTSLAAAPYARALPGLYTFFQPGGVGPDGYNVVGGVDFNVVGPDVVGATLFGGGGPKPELPNTILADFSSILGGYDNRVSGARATISGGAFNVAGATDAAVPGGSFNSARGKNSLTAGFKAKAAHDGCFVWNDRSVIGSNDSLVSTAANQFSARAVGGFRFLTEGAPNVSEGLFVHNGKLGVNTSSPIGSIHVLGADGPTTGLKLEATDGDRFNISYAPGEGVHMDSYRPSDGRRLPLLLQAVGGWVGIGTTEPGFLLEVNGDAAKPGGGSWSVASDARLKDVEKTFERGLVAIEMLEPVVYRYKIDNEVGLPSDESYVGLIAQEVEQAIPEAVSRDSRGYLHLNNDPIIWAMLNAIQDQQRQIDALRNELRAYRQAQ